MNEEHYKELATQWKKRIALFPNNHTAELLFRWMVDDFCYVAKEANPSFSREKFKEAVK
jgi:hypothetical protein